MITNFLLFWKETWSTQSVLKNYDGSDFLPGCAKSTGLTCILVNIYYCIPQEENILPFQYREAQWVATWYKQNHWNGWVHKEIWSSTTSWHDPESSKRRATDSSKTFVFRSQMRLASFKESSRAETLSHLMTISQEPSIWEWIDLL